LVKINKLLTVAIIAVAFIAMAGAANAKFAADVKIDKVQVNGEYRGIPTLLSSEGPIYGFEYTLVPDGTYTVFGTITNLMDKPLTVTVGGGTDSRMTASKTIAVPAYGTASFTLTFWAGPREDIVIRTSEKKEVDLRGVEFVNMPDNTVHTINMGPMSDAVAIFTNGVLNYNGQPAFSVGFGQ